MTTPLLALPELLPCAFCSHAEVRRTHEPDDCGGLSYAVQCCSDTCAIVGPARGSRSEADTAWNRRAHIEAARGGVNEAKGAVAWAAGLESNMRGFIDAMAWREGEFTIPLFTSAQADELRDLLAKVQTHLAVGCMARTGYVTRHNELAIEIQSALALQEPK